MEEQELKEELKQDFSSEVVREDEELLESYSFSVQMNVKEMCRFSFRHIYGKMSGIIGVFISIAAILMLITQFNEMEDQQKAVLFIAALWFTVLEPLSILSRAKGQVSRNPVYKKPLVYTVSEKGIRVSQDESSQGIEWNQIMKIIETKKQYLIYTNKVNAFIFPKADMEDKLEEIGKLIAKSTDGLSVKVSNTIKKRRG